MRLAPLFDARGLRFAVFAVTVAGGITAVALLASAGNAVGSVVAGVNLVVLLALEKFAFEQRQLFLAELSANTSSRRSLQLANEKLGEETRRLAERADQLNERAAQLTERTDQLAERATIAETSTERRQQQVRQRRDDDIAMISNRLARNDDHIVNLKRGLAAETQRSVGALLGLRESTSERRNSDIDRISGRLGRIETRLQHVATNGQSRSLLGIARLNGKSQSALDVVLLFTPQRTGSTRMFEIMRTHPTVTIDHTAQTWKRLGFTGRRYPTALASLDPDGQEFEVQAGIGSVLPPAPEVVPAAEARWFVEKAHPEFIDFDPNRLAEGISRMRADGRAVELVHVVRRPIDAMWSMLEYKRRDPKWYAWLEEASIPEFTARSYRTISQVVEELGGTVIDYEMGQRDVRALTDLAGRLGAEDPSSWLTGAQTWVDGDRKAATVEKSFTGERSANRTPEGPDGIWVEAAEHISEATEIWQQLLAPTRPA